MLTVTPIPGFTDNYFWLIHPLSTQEKPDSEITSAPQDAVIVDPGDAAPVLKFLKQHRLKLKAILITHHHWDHVGGVTELIQEQKQNQQKESIPVYGPGSIEVVTHPVEENNTINILNQSFEIIAVPGHTLSHINYYCANFSKTNTGILFTGDTLFSGSCGRMFEGTPEQFLHSLNKLKQLPESTKIYCAHEFTELNLRFAQSIEPNNSMITQYQQWVKQRRTNNQPSLPSTIGQEKAINPFFRLDQPEVQRTAVNLLARDKAKIKTNINTSTASELFAALRKVRDNFH